MWERIRATSLALPLIGFIAVTFLLPIGGLITRSFYDDTVATVLPDTAKELAAWDGKELPQDQTYIVLGKELKRAREAGTVGKVASRLNRIQSGSRSLISKTGRKLRNVPEELIPQTMREADDAWDDIATWHTLQKATQKYTSRHFLQSVDLTRNASGEIVQVDEGNRIYVALFIRTFWVSLAVTFICFLVGYPVAYAIAEATPNVRRVLLILVLIPFWTSLLVRTSAWIVLLQQQGTVNSILVWLGVIADEARLIMIHNMTGTLVAMTHVLLPFMVLPLYSVMQAIPPHFSRAAAALGANPLQSFLRVYWPQSLPGVGAGVLLVFILSIGYYITPALVGGAKGQLISNLIAYHLQTSLNWGLAAALSTILLVLVLVLYLVFDRVIGIDRLKLG